MFKSNILYILGIACLFIVQQSDSSPLKVDINSAADDETTVLTEEPIDDTTIMRLFPMSAGNNTIEKAGGRTLERQAEGEEGGGEEGAGEAAGGGAGEAAGEGAGEAAGGGAGEAASGGAEGGGAEGGGAEGGGAEGGGAEGGGAEGGGEAAAAAGGAEGGKEGENASTTKIVPKFVKDHMGNWVYNLWGATFGNIWKDTRFEGPRTQERIKVDSDAVKEYYPGEELSTACMDASTIYNIPGVKKWLVRKIYKSPIKQRPIWHALRLQIYKQGNSEECHDLTKYSNPRDYQECALRRDMRLESLIPMYPMHQLGWGF